MLLQEVLVFSTNLHFILDQGMRYIHELLVTIAEEPIPKNELINTPDIGGFRYPWAITSLAYSV